MALVKTFCSICSVFEIIYDLCVVFFFSFIVWLSSTLSLHLIVSCLRTGFHLLHIPSWTIGLHIVFPETLTYCLFGDKTYQFMETVMCSCSVACLGKKFWLSKGFSQTWIPFVIAAFFARSNSHQCWSTNTCTSIRQLLHAPLSQFFWGQFPLRLFKHVCERVITKQRKTLAVSQANDNASGE